MNYNISNDLKKINQTQFFMANLPSVQSAIYFESFSRIDSIVENLIFQESRICGFYLTDKYGQSIFSKLRDYNDNKISFKKRLSNEKYHIIDNHLIISEPISKTDKSILITIPFERLFSNYSETIDYKDFNFTLSTIDIANFEVESFMSSRTLIKSYMNYIYTNFSYLLFWFLFLCLGSLLFVKNLIKPVNIILNALKNISKENITLDTKVPAMFKPIWDNIEKANKHVLDSIEEKRISEIRKVQMETFQQVAHDIKSPLETLKITNEMLPDNNETSEIIRSAINRISQISEDLSLKASQKSKDTFSQPSLIQQIIKEKINTV
jgi:signal transduction histidine kinase